MENYKTSFIVFRSNRLYVTTSASLTYSENCTERRARAATSPTQVVGGWYNC